MTTIDPHRLPDSTSARAAGHPVGEVTSFVDPDRTRQFGPRPPVPPRTGRDHRRLARVGIVLGAGLGLVVGGLGLHALVTDDRVSASAPEAISPSGPEPGPGSVPEVERCPELAPLAVPPGGRVMEVDLLGTGCPVPVAWDGRVLSLRLEPTDAVPRRYELAVRRGGPGQLLFGDWDCDGTRTPGYYQPATGAVSTFGRVPTRVGDELSARTEDSGVLDGRAVVAPGTGGCDEVAVTPRA